jgi:Acetyltransferase (GNAT) domain
LNSKNYYIAYCQRHTFPLFVQAYWFDAINTHWDVWQYTSADGHDYFLPYVVEKKLIFKLIRNPLFTPYSGIVCNNNIHLQEAIMFFIQKINAYDLFELDFAIDFKHAVAFENNQFKCVLQRTNILNLQCDTALLFSNFKDTLKRQIKKCDHNLIITTCNNVDTIHTLLSASYKKQQLILPYSKQLLQSMIDTCNTNNCGQIWLAKNAEGLAVAVLWQVWDKHTSYYLTGGSNGQYSEAMSGLMWHAIKHAQQIGAAHFDFEGSNINSINKFFSNFAPTATSYFRISKTNTPLLKWMQKISDFLKFRQKKTHQ